MRELEIAPPQFPKDLIREPRLDMSDISAVQALVMGYLRKRARTKRAVPLERKHLLTILDSQTLGKD